MRRIEADPAVGPSVIDELTGVLQPEVLLLRRRVVRPDDLFVGDFVFPNLRLEGDGAAQRLRRVRPAEPAAIVLLLQGQSVAEEVIRVEDTPPRRGLAAALSGPSNLVFRMPDAEPSLAFTLPDLLSACQRWPMVLDPRAARDPITGPGGVSGTLMGASLADGPGLVRALSATLDAAGQQNLRRAVTIAARRTSLGAEDREAALERAFSAARGSADVDAQDVARALFDLTLTGMDPGLLPGLIDDFVAPLLVQRPSRSVTYVESPYRLFLSPQTGARWHHPTTPVTVENRTELWQTRLGRRFPPDPSESPPAQPVRAIWSTAQLDGAAAAPVLPDTQTAMRDTHRRDLVALTASRGEAAGAFQPSPIPTQVMTLSALGSGLTLEGNWPEQPQGVSVSSWRHISSFARDHYVRIVEEGILFPFGHRAARIIISEREFKRSEAGDDVIGFLERREFIIIRQNLRQYPLDSQVFGGRDLPFREVEILDKATPNITADPVLQTPGQVQFVERNGTPFPFSLRMVDLGGLEHTTDLAMAFVTNTELAEDGFLDNLSAAYATIDVTLRQLAFGGSEMQVVALPEGQTGDVILPTQSVVLGMPHTGAGEALDLSRFAPRAEEMEVAIPSVTELAPGALSTPTQAIRYVDMFLNEGLGANNPGAVFAELVDPLSLAFGGANASTEDAGGMMSPDMSIGGLSSTFGVLGDLGEILDENPVPQLPRFDLEEFFGGARLLGAIPISDLFAGVSLLASDDGAPEIKTTPLENPPGTETRLHWSTEITSTAVEIFVPRAGNQDTQLILDVCQVTRVTGSDADLSSETRIAADLSNFKLNLIGCLILWFDRLEYEKLPGAEARVDPTLHAENAVVFGGPLEFVNGLSDILPDTGLGGASVDVSPVGIVAGFDLAIPNVQVGVLALTNMAVGLRLSLPFNGDPVTLRFNFAEREDPFNVSVSLLGGGGFFALALGTDGVREVEAALEFGACIAFDIGIASGGACVLVGIYFRWGLTSEGTTEVELTGYLEISGELSVLGLIRISIVFYLAFTYEKDEAAGMSTVWGIATVTVEVEVLFFSTSVELTVERRLGGSPADPGFLDFIPDQTVWDRYADAFA